MQAKVLIPITGQYNSGNKPVWMIKEALPNTFEILLIINDAGNKTIFF
jgi:hypothetical protein